MKKERKVVLFIVEGSTDRDSLLGVLQKVFESSSIKFLVMSGDFTVNYGNDPSNIRKNLVDFVKSEMRKYGLSQKDMIRLIHLVDTDGAFIPDENILPLIEGERICYEAECIKHPSPEKIVARNLQKRGNLGILTSTSSLWKIPYSCFYFSRNLEHVLHNLDAELSLDEKMDLADDFADQYESQPQEFMEFMKNSEFVVSENYQESWKFIRNGIRSLQRYSNFHIALDLLEQGEF